MYAIVEISGHQYKVDPGRIVDVAKLDAEAGTTVDLDNILLVGGEGETIVGQPKVSGAKIKAKVINQDKDNKLFVLKRKVGKWQRTRGHRTHFTTLLVTEITDGKGKSAVIDSSSKEAEKYLK